MSNAASQKYSTIKARNVTHVLRGTNIISKLNFVTKSPVKEAKYSFSRSKNVYVRKTIHMNITILATSVLKTTIRRKANVKNAGKDLFLMLPLKGVNAFKKKASILMLLLQLAV